MRTSKIIVAAMNNSSKESFRQNQLTSDTMRFTAVPPMLGIRFTTVSSAIEPFFRKKTWRRRFFLHKQYDAPQPIAFEQHHSTNPLAASQLPLQACSSAPSPSDKHACSGLSRLILLEEKEGENDKFVVTT